MRDYLQREEDRDRIAYFLSLGYQSTAKIAQLINAEKTENFISKATVATDIKVLEQEIKEKRVENVQVWRTKLLNSFMLGAEMAIESFEKSKRNVVKIKSTVVVDNEAYDDIAQNGVGLSPQNENIFLRQAIVEETTNPAGNPAFLAEWHKNLDKVTKLLGIDAPSKIALTDPSGEKPLISPAAQLLEELNKTKEQLTYNEPKQLEENNDD